MEDIVAMTDAKILLTAGMTAVLVQVDTPKKLEAIFQECMGDACAGYAYQLHEPLHEGTAATREHWQRMIMKFLRAFGTGERGIRTVKDFFDVMLKRAVERVDDEKLNQAKQDPKLRSYRERML
jgi:hypothetical protein